MDATPPRDDLSQPEDVLADLGWVRGFASRLLDDPHLAEDVAQETWQAYVTRPPSGPRRPWLAGVVRRLAAMKIRARVRRRRRERALPRRGPADPAETALARAETQRRLVTMLLELDEPYRTALLLRYFGGLAPAAIARREGVPPATVRSWLQRGLERCRKRLESEDGPEWRAPLVPLLAGAAWFGRRAIVAVAGAAVLLVAIPLLVFSEAGPSRDENLLSRAPRAAEHAAAPSDAESAEAAVVSSSPFREPGQSIARGRVVDESGNGVAGASVLALTRDRDQAAIAAASSQAGTWRGESDAKGYFEIPVSMDGTALALFADKAGWSPAVDERAEVEAPVTLTLTRAGSIRGTVSGPDGAPIAGARIAWMACLGGVAVTREARSDAEGRYSLECAGSAARLQSCSIPFEWMEASAAGFAPIRFRATTDRPSDSERDLHLSHGCTVRLTVRSAPGGAPVGGVRVWLWSDTQKASRAGGLTRNLPDPFAPWVPWEAKSDGDGAAVFEHVAFWDRHAPPWTAQYVVKPSLMAAALTDDGRHALASVVLPGEGAQVAVDLALQPTPEVRGRVVDESGNAVSDAIVLVENGRTTWDFGVPPPLEVLRGTTVTAPDGTFVLRHLDAGTTTSYRYGVAQPQSLNDQLAEFELHAPFPWPHDAGDLVLIRLHRVDFHVRDRSGNPIAGALVGRSAWPNTLNEGIRFVHTGRDGRATLWLRPRSAYESAAPRPLYVHAPGWVPACLGPVDAEEDGQVIDVTLARGVTLRGRARIADGRPALRTRVVALSGRLGAADAPAVLTRLFDGHAPEESLLGESIVRHDGSFVLHDLPSEPCHVAVVPNLHGAPSAVFAYAVDPERFLDMTMPAPLQLRGGTTVAGAVTLAGGRVPLEPVTVLLARDGEILPGIATGPGLFGIYGVPDGRWSLRAFLRGNRLYAREIEVPADAEVVPVTIELARGAGISGRVSCEPPRPFHRASITFLPGDGLDMPQTVPLAVDGRFRVDGLELDRSYRVSVAHEVRDGRTAWLVPEDERRVFRVSEAAIGASHDWMLVPAGSAEIVVPKESWVIAPDRPRSRLQIHDPDGELCWEYAGRWMPRIPVCLEAGAYVVSLAVPGAPPVRRALRLVEEASTQFEIRP